jgi:hypothetical protein
VLVVGLLVGLASACGKTDEAHRAAGIVPADALAYLSLTLDPSLLQKKDLFEIGLKFPAAAKLIKGNFDVSRDNLLEAAVRRVCLNYRSDVKPWLGSELAVALLPPPRGGSAPAGAVLIKVEDRAKAKVALDRAVSRRCASGSAGSAGSAVSAASTGFFGSSGSADSGGSTGSFGSAGSFGSTGSMGSSDSVVQYRFVDGYAVVVAEHSVADGTVILDAVQNEAAKGAGGLAATPAFANAVAHLADDRLAVGWVDVPALARLVSSRTRSSRGTDVSGLSRCDVSSLGLGPSAGQVAFDVRATPSSLLMEGVVGGSTKSLAHGPASITQGLPGSTMAEATLYGLGPLVRTVLNCTGLMDKAATSFNRATGLDLNNDILAQLGGESVLVVGSVPPGDRLPELGFVTAVADHTRAKRAVDQVVATLQAKGEDVTQTTLAGVTAYEIDLQSSSDLLTGVQPSFALVGDRLVVASTPEYLVQLATKDPASLGTTADYRSAVGSVSGDATSGQLLIRFGQISVALDAALRGSAKDTFDRRVAPEMAPLRDLVVRSYIRAGLARFELRLTFS